MDSAQIAVTIIGALLIAFTLWFFFGKREDIQTAHDDDKYACPMHSWITSNDPSATCSICGMKLTARE